MRILLLAAIGVAVYLKFDTVVSSTAFQKLHRSGEALSALFAKGESPAEPASLAAGLRWAADSGAVEAECGSAKIDSCLDRWSGLGEDALGTLRASLQKAEAQWDVVAAGGFTARFQRLAGDADLLNPGGTVLSLARLDVRGAKGDVYLSRAPGGSAAPLCAAERCLDALHPRPPFARFRRNGPAPAADPSEARIPEAAFSPLEASAAKPILRGRVVELPSGGTGWMKLYHGGNLFSYYRGFTRVRPGLSAGSMVNAEDTLGQVIPGEDTLAGLELRIEKDGLMVDPVAYLGLPVSDSAGAIHGR